MSKSKNYLEIYGKKYLSGDYQIVPILHGKKRPSVKNWQKNRVTEAVHAEWLSNPLNTGVGILAGNTIGVDVDVRNEALAHQMVQFTLELLGESPIRIGEEPKCLLFYRPKNKEFTKLTSIKYRDLKGNAHQIEILGSGGQMVVGGIHPKTKRPYYFVDHRWEKLRYEKGLLSFRRSELSTITKKQAIKIIRYFESIVPKNWEKISKGSTSRKRGKSSQSIDIEHIEEPCDISELKAIKLLEKLDPDIPYDDWIKVGMAIYHQFSGSKLGYKIWKTWSKAGAMYIHGDCSKTKWHNLDATNKNIRPVTFASVIAFSKSSEYCKRNEELRCLLETNKGDSKTKNRNPTQWTNGFLLSDAEINAIDDPEWIIKNMVIKGHVIAIVAEPNGGKTTIFLHLASEMASMNFKVFYVNADTSGGDAKPMHSFAREKGFKLMLPDMVAGGKSMDDVVENLREMSQADGADYSNYVFIFDTLKKMTDVINKARSKELYKLLRALSSKGMTVIVLGHTNKHKVDGNFIFEGTGDLRADVDELIILVPEKHSDGSMVVTTELNKVRGAFESITYKLDSSRHVTLLDEVVDTTANRFNLEKVKRDSDIIQAIDSAISDGYTSQKDIISSCKLSADIKEHTVKRALKEYSTSASLGHKV